MEPNNILIAQLDLIPKGIILRNCVIEGGNPEVDQIKCSTGYTFNINEIYQGAYTIVEKDPIRISSYCKAEHNSFAFSEIISFIDAQSIYNIMLWDPILGWLTFNLNEEPISDVMEAISQRYWALFNLLCRYYDETAVKQIHDSVVQSLQCIIKAIPIEVRSQCRKALEVAVDNFICAHQLSAKLDQELLKSIKSNICSGDWLHGVQHKCMRTEVFTHVAISVTNIQWDTSDEDSYDLCDAPDLPESIDIKLPIQLAVFDTAKNFIQSLPAPFDIEEQIADFLSDTYGFCVENFEWEGTTFTSDCKLETYDWNK